MIQKNLDRLDRRLKKIKKNIYNDIKNTIYQISGHAPSCIIFITALILDDSLALINIFKGQLWIQTMSVISNFLLF